MRRGRVFFLLFIRQQIHGELYLIGIQRGIGAIGDKVFVKTIVSIIVKQVGDALTLVIKNVYIESHALMKQGTCGIGKQIVVNAIIVNVIRQAVYYVRLSGIDNVFHPHLIIAYTVFFQANSRSHIAHILYSLLHLGLGFYGFCSVVYHRSVAQSTQEAVYPLS